jgi:Acyl-CoA dehydrogenase, C-terminal domain
MGEVRTCSCGAVWCIFCHLLCCVVLCCVVLCCVVLCCVVLCCAVLCCVVVCCVVLCCVVLCCVTVHYTTNTISLTLLRLMYTGSTGGLSADHPLAAMWSAARTLRIVDGPDEVHLRTLAKLETGNVPRTAPKNVPGPQPGTGKSRL